MSWNTRAIQILKNLFVYLRLKHIDADSSVWWVFGSQFSMRRWGASVHASSGEYLIWFTCLVIQKLILFGTSWRVQKRGWGQTLMELISPLLMMSLVVWGWWRSTEVHYGLEFPVNSTIPLFKALKNEYGTAQSLLQICPPDRLLAQVSLNSVWKCLNFWPWNHTSKYENFLGFSRFLNVACLSAGFGFSEYFPWGVGLAFNLDKRGCIEGPGWITSAQLHCKHDFRWRIN